MNLLIAALNTVARMAIVVLLSIGCVAQRLKIEAEMEPTPPPVFQPHITISSSILPPDVKNVELFFEEPANISFNLTQSGPSGDWTLPLSREQIKNLLGNANERRLPAKVSARLVNSKGYPTYYSVNVEILVKQPGAT
jgi:hypothetical protein